MQNNTIFSVFFFILSLSFLVGTFFLLQDIKDNQDLNLKSSDFYSLSGSVQKIVIEHHPKSGTSSETATVHLHQKNGAWHYSSTMPNYTLLLEQLKKCGQIDLFFKKREFLDNSGAEIWHAALCGKTVIHFKQTLDYKKNIQNQKHFRIKVFIFTIFLLLLILLLCFSLRSGFKRSCLNS